MTQRKWLDLIKDYDLTINYHPGKEDRVVDALSRKTSQTLVIMDQTARGIGIRGGTVNSDFVARTVKRLKQKIKDLWWLEPLEIPKWKWKHINGFVTGLPRTRQGQLHMGNCDRLTKSAPFYPMCTLHPRQASDYEIVRLHGILLSIVSDRDPRFPSPFWNSFQQAMGMKVKLSTAYHPQTDGQIERTIQTLERHA
ncbi:UNVERIFIED_CONTAM: Transposon Ty3-G Gag-Pol polyprotein [Sesamum latifolium]|uniref:Transposon Ty3-G Gag-Pol polyprotein n=1 Tax=Sesamum latifolium TaxID=2727402 RepID=A0AAW2VGB9_9LAMI